MLVNVSSLYLSLSSHKRHLVFFNVLLIFALIWLFLVASFSVAIKRYSVSLLRFSFRSHCLVISYASLLVCVLKYQYSCFFFTLFHFQYFVVLMFVPQLFLLILQLSLYSQGFERWKISFPFILTNTFYSYKKKYNGYHFIESINLTIFFFVHYFLSFLFLYFFHTSTTCNYYVMFF